MKYMILCMALFAMAPFLSAKQVLAVNLQKASVRFLDSLSERQQSKIIQKFDDQARWEMRYTGGNRKGVQIMDLNAAQRKQIDGMLGLILSQNGLHMADKVAKLDGPKGIGRLVITFFGDPRKTDKFAWRVAEHHFTLVDLFIKNGNIVEFGPFLLGANPPVLWEKQEKMTMDIWQTLGAQQEAVFIKKKKAFASFPMKKGHGVAIKNLPKATQQAVKKVWVDRLSLLSPSLRSRFESLVKQGGGLLNLNLAFYNKPPLKRCKDGGRWDFKIGGPGVVFDFETSRKHIHMSMWVRSSR